MAPDAGVDVADDRVAPDAAIPMDVAVPSDVAADVTHADTAVADAADAADASDAPSADAATDSSTACSITGTWTYPGGGALVFFVRFRTDGGWRFSNGESTLETSPIDLGGYTATETQLTVDGHDPDGGIPGDCLETDTGVYGLAFEPGCGAVRLTLVRDDCGDRAGTWPGMRWQRVP